MMDGVSCMYALWSPVYECYGTVTHTQKGHHSRIQSMDTTQWSIDSPIVGAIAVAFADVTIIPIASRDCTYTIW